MTYKHKRLVPLQPDIWRHHLKLAWKQLANPWRHRLCNDFVAGSPTLTSLSLGTRFLGRQTALAALSSLSSTPPLPTSAWCMSTTSTGQQSWPCCMVFGNTACLCLFCHSVCVSERKKRGLSVFLFKFHLFFLFIFLSLVCLFVPFSLYLKCILQVFQSSKEWVVR